MVLPLGILKAAEGRPMLVELKDGETLNGHLVSSDSWMNLMLKEVVQTSPNGTVFMRLPEVYVRGNNIKYLRVPDETVDVAKQQQTQHQNSHHSNRGGRGGRGGNYQRSEHHGGRGGGGAGGGPNNGGTGNYNSSGNYRGIRGRGRGGRGT